MTPKRTSWLAGFALLIILSVGAIGNTDPTTCLFRVASWGDDCSRPHDDGSRLLGPMEQDHQEKQAILFNPLIQILGSAPKTVEEIYFYCLQRGYSCNGTVPRYSSSLIGTATYQIIANQLDIAEFEKVCELELESRMYDEATLKKRLNKKNRKLLSKGSLDLVSFLKNEKIKDPALKLGIFSKQLAQEPIIYFCAILDRSAKKSLGLRMAQKMTENNINPTQAQLLKLGSNNPFYFKIKKSALFPILKGTNHFVEEFPFSRNLEIERNLLNQLNHAWLKQNEVNIFNFDSDYPSLNLPVKDEFEKQADYDARKRGAILELFSQADYRPIKISGANRYDPETENLTIPIFQDFERSNDVALSYYNARNAFNAEVQVSVSEGNKKILRVDPSNLGYFPEFKDKYGVDYDDKKISPAAITMSPNEARAKKGDYELWTLAAILPVKWQVYVSSDSKTATINSPWERDITTYGSRIYPVALFLVDRAIGEIIDRESFEFTKTMIDNNPRVFEEYLRTTSQNVERIN